MLIDFKNVNICHLDGESVLKGINFHVDEGEFIYLIGRVGAGKSSLLKTIYFEMDVESAKVATVFGKDLMTLHRRDIPELRRQMGIIFQDFQLLGDRTVFQNLRFVLMATGWKDKERIKERIDEVLHQVGMEDKIDRMPHELSGGEQQRIVIARALLNSPKLIVADEPTGNLDAETADAIIQLLREISQTGTAVVLTTHNRHLIDSYPGIVYRCADEHLQEVTKDYSQLLSDEEFKD